MGNATLVNNRRFWRQWGLWLAFGVLLLIALGVAYSRDARVTEAVLASTLRQAVPLVLGALCGLMGERAGVINIGIEGQMLLAAFVGFLVNVWTGNLFLAVMAGVLVGVRELNDAEQTVTSGGWDALRGAPERGSPPPLRDTGAFLPAGSLSH